MTLQEIKDYVKTLKGTSVPQRPIEYIEHLLSEVESSQAHAADCESMRYQIRDLSTDNEKLAAENKELKKELEKVTHIYTPIFAGGFGREAMTKDYLCKVKTVEDLIAEVKALEQKIEKLEGDYQKMITEVLKLNPIPANKYGDQLEPPWEVIKRARLRLAKLEAELERERMRLAACGTAALGYFDGKCHDDYRSASLEDTQRLYENYKKALAKIEKLEAVRKAAEELTGCCIHACEPRTLDKLGELQQALKDAEVEG